MNSPHRYRQVALIVAVVTLVALLAGWGYISTRTRSASVSVAAPVGVESAVAAQQSAAAAERAAAQAARAAAQQAAAKAAADQAAAAKAAAEKAAAAAARVAAEKATAGLPSPQPRSAPAPAPRQAPVTRQAPPQPAGPVSSWVTLLHPHCTGTPGNYTLTFSIRWSNGHVETPPADTGPSNGVTDLDYDYAGQSHWNAYPVNFGCPS